VATQPAVSVFTPSHNPQYLADAWKSLAKQTFKDFEWVLVLNGPASTWMPPFSDDRIKVHRVEQLRGVGAAKSYACERARGKLLVELDHDDVLSWDCLANLVALHDDTGAGFLYSDTAETTEKLEASDNRWDGRYGWEYYDTFVNGRKVRASKALAPTPANVSYIWWAPNHLRAFTREAYEKAGGYDADRTVLDDQDLMCRLFLVTEFAKYDGCLYLQRLW
jgi:O-antigen biosynthesis protein